MTSGNHVSCARCKNPLDAPGAFAFPPIWEAGAKEDVVFKTHLCAACWEEVRCQIFGEAMNEDYKMVSTTPSRRCFCS